MNSFNVTGWWFACHLMAYFNPALSEGRPLHQAGAFSTMLA
jgi:hypothetical protein